METVTQGDKSYKVHGGIFFSPKTSEEVIRVITRLYNSQTPCRVFYGDTETGTVWAEEHDVSGKIGRSMGPVKVPLLVEKGEDCGGAMLDHCIVGILVKGASWFYKHPTFDAGTWEIRRIDPVEIAEHLELFEKGYSYEVLHNRLVHARFKGVKAKAERYVDFMTGKRIRK